MNTHKLPRYITGTSIPWPWYFYHVGGGSGEGDGGEGEGEGEGGGGAVTMVNTDGTFTDDFYNSQGEENKAYLSRYKDPSSLAKGALDTKKKFGKDPNTMVEIPRAGSSDDVIQAFKDARGVPKDVKGYNFVASKDIPDNVKFTDADIDGVKAIAIKHNMNDAQLNGFVNDYLISQGPVLQEFANQMEDNKLERAKEGNAILNQIHKEAAPQVKVMANLMLDKYGLDEIKFPDNSVSSIKGELLTNHPGLLEDSYFAMLLDTFGKKMDEDVSHLGGTGGGDTAADIDGKIADVREQMDAITVANPHNYRSNPKYKELKKLKTSLYVKRSK